MTDKNASWFKFYPADFMNGVRGLSAQEVGVYTMILCRIYEESAPVEYHPLRLSTYCGMRLATFEKTLRKLLDLGKLILRDGMLFNARAEIEISNRSHDLKIASKGGKASAKKRQQNQQNASTDVQPPFKHTDTDTDTDIDKGSGKYSSDEESLPPPQVAAVEISDLLGELAAAVGYPPDAIPKAWSGPKAAQLVGAWRASGLSDPEILDRARRSRAIHPEPPAAPAALASFMGRPNASPAEAAPQPLDPAIALQNLARTINAWERPPPSICSPSRARELIAARLVTPEHLKAKGIAF